jgi:hypothetical protein
MERLTKECYRRKLGNVVLWIFETGFPEELFMGLEELDEEDADAVYSALKRICQKLI